MTATARAPMVKLTELWERTSAQGNRYFSGYLGASQVLVFLEGERPHPTREGETVTVWNVMLQEKAQTPTQGTRSRASGIPASQACATSRHGPTRPVTPQRPQAPSERPSLAAVAMGAVAPPPDDGPLPDDTDWLERAWR